MTMDSPKSSSTDEICSMCKRPKSQHTPEELSTCSRKMREFKEEKGGAGIV